MLTPRQRALLQGRRLYAPLGISGRVRRATKAQRLAIPDSVVHQWPMDEGSGSTVADNIGDADLTISQAEWGTDTDYVGEHYLDFDQGDSEQIDSNQTNVGDTGCVVATVWLDNIVSGENRMFTHNDTNGDNRIYLMVEEEEWAWGLAASIDQKTGVSPSTNTNYRFGLNWDEGSYQVFVDGSVIDSGSYSGTLSDTTSGEWVFGEEFGQPLDGRLDNVIFSEEPFSSDEITSDYDSQPWS